MGSRGCSPPGRALQPQSCAPSRGRFVLSPARSSHLAACGSGPRRCHLDAQQLCQHVGIMHLISGSRVKSAVQHLGSLRQPQVLHVLHGVRTPRRWHATSSAPSRTPTPGACGRPLRRTPGSPSRPEPALRGPSRTSPSLEAACGDSAAERSPSESCSRHCIPGHAAHAANTTQFSRPSDRRPSM